MSNNDHPTGFQREQMHQVLLKITESFIGLKVHPRSDSMEARASFLTRRQITNLPLTVQVGLDVIVRAAFLVLAFQRIIRVITYAA